MMNNHKKLQNFTFSDNFSWSFPEVQTEALNAALRRADVMGWSEISINPISTAPEIEGHVKNYKFEIWGIGESLFDISENKSPSDSSEGSHKQVARDADI